MKKNHKKLLKVNNAVDPAAPASRMKKGVPGKGGKTTNYEIPEWMFQRELNDMMEGKQHA